MSTGPKTQLHAEAQLHAAVRRYDAAQAALARAADEEESRWAEHAASVDALAEVERTRARLKAERARLQDRLSLAETTTQAATAERDAALAAVLEAQDALARTLVNPS